MTCSALSTRMGCLLDLQADFCLSRMPEASSLAFLAAELHERWLHATDLCQDMEDGRWQHLEPCSAWTGRHQFCLRQPGQSHGQPVALPRCLARRHSVAAHALPPGCSQGAFPHAPCQWCCMHQGCMGNLTWFMKVVNIRILQE